MDDAREPCDRAELIIRRAEMCGWITFVAPYGRQQLLASIRIALDMEVEADGPFTVTSTPPRWPIDA